MSTLKNKYRSAVRTLRRGVGLGPQKIRNLNFGTEVNQCDKFSRFEELYEENIDSLDMYVKNVLWAIRMDQIYFYNSIRTLLSDEPLPEIELKKIIKYMTDDINHNAGIQTYYLSQVENNNRKSRTLVNELNFYIPFQQSYIINKLTQLQETGKMNIDSFINCVKPPYMYKIPRRAPLPSWSSRKTRRTSRRSGLKR